VRLVVVEANTGADVRLDLGRDSFMKKEHTLERAFAKKKEKKKQQDLSKSGRVSSCSSSCSGRAT
jgi:hypothetical protein